MHGLNTSVLIFTLPKSRWGMDCLREMPGHMGVVFLTSQTPSQRRVGQIPNVLDGQTTDLAVKLAH
jgi:hypothetical protein